MKNSTLQALEYLTTPEGKAEYRRRLEYHFAEWDGTASGWMMIFDRFFGYALIDVLKPWLSEDTLADPGHLSDDLLDFFGYPRKNGTYGSDIPRLVARVTRIETMVEKFARYIDGYLRGEETNEVETVEVETVDPVQRAREVSAFVAEVDRQLQTDHQLLLFGAFNSLGTLEVCMVDGTPVGSAVIALDRGKLIASVTTGAGTYIYR